MNGSLLIVPPTAFGQASSIAVGATPEKGDNGFAESLAAALGGAMSTAIPAQQRTTSSVSAQGGSLVDGSTGDETSATARAVPAGKNTGAGVPRPAGHLDHGVRAEAAGTSAASGIPADAAPILGLRSAAFVKDASNATRSADVEARPAYARSLDLVVPKTAKTDDQLSPEFRHSERMPNRTEAGRQVAGVAPHPAGTDADAHPAAGSSIMPRLGGQPLTDAVIAPAPRSSETVAQPNGQEDAVPPNTSQVLTPPPEDPDALPARPPSSGSIVDQNAAVKLSLSQTFEAIPKIAATRPVTVSERPAHPHRSIQTPTESADPGIRQRDVAGLANGRIFKSSGVSSLLADGHQAAAALPTQAAPTVAGRTGDTIEPSIPSAVRNSASRSDEVPVSSGETAGKPMAPAAPTGGSAQITSVEGSLRQTAEFNGFDRSQSALPFEGGTFEIERFEPASVLGPARARSPEAQPSAGAQIALQIVRSLPGGADRLSVHLQPAELGSVDIQLDFEGSGRVSAIITAERAETLELLQRDSRLLERSFGDSGLKLAGDGLSFALKQDQQQQQHGQNFHDQGQPRPAAFHAGRVYDDASDVEQQSSAPRVDGRRLLDIHT